MHKTPIIEKPEIFLRHTADLCFIGQDVFEMRPGELWLFTRYCAHYDAGDGGFSFPPDAC